MASHANDQRHVQHMHEIIVLTLSLGCSDRNHSKAPNSTQVREGSAEVAIRWRANGGEDRRDLISSTVQSIDTERSGDL